MTNVNVHAKIVVRMPSSAHTSRSFVVVARSEPLAADARRVLVPYRRTQWVQGLDEARAWIDRNPPPVGLVLENDLGASSGLDVLKRVREKLPFVPAVLLASSPSAEQLERGFTLRASYLPLPLDVDALMPFVFRALTEEFVADERVGCLVESLVRGRVLTLREAELLVLVIGDVPRGRILTRMGVSENTLKGHVRQLLRKLEAGDLDKLAARVFRVALQNGGRTPSLPPPKVSGERNAVRADDEDEDAPTHEVESDGSGRR